MLKTRLSIAEINELPNGLHDANILRLTYDIEASKLVFEVDVWIGEMEPAETRETYRRGLLEFTGVCSFTKDEAEHLDDARLHFLNWELTEDPDFKARLGEEYAQKKAFSFYVLRCTIEIICDDVFLAWIADARIR